LGSDGSVYYTSDHYDIFIKFNIEELVNDGDLIEVPVQKPYVGFQEQWYKCTTCSQVWRLVHPDFPFKGLWNIVK